MSPLPTPEELSNLRELTSSSLSRLQNQIAAFPLEAWTSKPEDGGWSAAEIAEHVILVNNRLLAAVELHRSDPVNPEWADLTKEKEIWIRTVLPSQGKAKAGELVSTFRGLSPVEAAPHFAEFLTRALHFLSAAETLPLHGIVWQHPFLGPLSAYQWLLYIPFHTARHQAQMQRLTEPIHNLFSE